MTIGEVPEDIIQRWVLDPEQYKKGIADVAKLIQQQSKHERDLATVRAELDKTTSSLSTKMSSLNDMMGKAGISTSLLAGGVGGLVATIGTKLIGALADGAAKFRAFINSGDDFNDTVEENRESVWRMTEATQHMGSAMEVAKFRAKLMASEGLKPTEQQLEDLTRAATNLAAKQKTDWSEAAEKLSNTWQGMGARALKPLNIEIDQNNTLMGKQYQILQGVQSLTEATLTQLEKEKALIKEKDDAYLHLSSSMNDNSAIAAVMNFTQVDRIKNEIAWVKSLELGYQRAYAFMSKVIDQSILGKGASSRDLKEGSFLGPAWKGGTGVDEGSGPETVTGKLLTLKSGAKKGGGARKKDASGFDADLEQIAKELEEELQYVVDAATKRTRQLLSEERKQREGDVEAGGEHERLRLGEEFKKFAVQAGRDKSVDKLQSSMGGMFMGNKLAEGARKSAQALEEYRTVVQGLNDDMGAFSKGALADFAGGMWSAADAAIQGGQSFGAAMLQMTKATLLGIAQQSTIKAIFNLAEAAAQWFNPYAVSMHLTAAALYGSIAVVAGAAGLGISAATAGSSKSAGAGASASHGSNSYKPSYGSSSNKDKQPLVINVWLGGKNDPAAALYMRQQIRAAAA